MSEPLIVRRPAAFAGEVRTPPDKSLTHRAYMLGAIAEGPCRVRNPLQSEDAQATLECLAQMGLAYDWTSPNEVRLTPAARWESPSGTLDCGNSGTTMRLLSGLIASRPIRATLIGDASLSRRPMKRIAEPLRLMGATVEGDTPPLHIVGGDLVGIDYVTPVPSAQIKTCVLFAGLRASGPTSVTESVKSRDHTERMLRAAGVEVREEGLTVTVQGDARVQPFEFECPGDISSAAFFLVAGAAVSGAEVVLRGVGVNPTRTGVLEVFAQCGIAVRSENEQAPLGEPMADLWVRQEGPGMPFTIDAETVPRLIDEIPVLAILATQLDGVSRIRGAAELRVKESDRIQAIASGLKVMGAQVTTYPDGMDIAGPVRLRGATIDAGGDHRIAMAFAIAGLLAEGETRIMGSEAIRTSYPGFEQDLWRLCTF